MALLFNMDEIYEIAEQIERNGAKFYRRVAESAADARPKELLLNLAAMEDEHEKVFAEMRSELSAKEKSATIYDPEGESAMYLRAMADGRVFDTKTDPSERLTGNETMEEILHTAIGLEKNSIVFYLGMKDMVPEKLGKDRMDDIIKEEMSHITKLSNELVAIEKG